MYITPGAFAGDNTIKHYRVPDGVTRIGRAAFAACPELSVVVLPYSLRNIEDAAFAGCPIKKVIYLGSSEDWAKVKVDNGVWGEDVDVVCSADLDVVQVAAADACMLNSCLNELICSRSVYSCANVCKLRRCSGKLDLNIMGATPEFISVHVSLAVATLECIQDSHVDFGARYYAVQRLEQAIEEVEKNMFNG